jgi:predicted O-methyltransferase YrrM
MKRWLRQVAKEQLFTIHRLGTRLGVHILPVHYYSPLPSLLELEQTRDVWAKRSALPGLGFDLDQQVKNLETICLPYQAEYLGNHAYTYATTNGFGQGYGYIEAQALHAVLRHYKPKRVLEIGSGVSTWCILHALGLNEQEGAGDFHVTSVEPYPSDKLKSLDRIELIAKPVQRVSFDEAFAQLGANDLLFIDSSHAVKPGSDVNYLILEVLPRLAPGVIVHFHDIYLPYDYPRFVLKSFFHWMETSLLRAFLVNNSKAEVIFCESLLHYDRPDVLKKVFPEYIRQPDTDGLGPKKPFQFASADHFPSSLYLRIK